MNMQQQLEQRIATLKASLDNQREQFRRKTAAAVLNLWLSRLVIGTADAAMVNKVSAECAVESADALLDALGWTTDEPGIGETSP